MNGYRSCVRKALTIAIIIFSFLVGCCTNYPPKEVCESTADEESSIKIVETPIFGEVTNQIMEKLLGRWISGNENEFFEIRENGEYCVSSICENGTSVFYTEKETELVAFYEKWGLCILEFRLRVGSNTTPSTSIMSLCYYCDYLEGIDELCFDDGDENDFIRTKLVDSEEAISCYKKDLLVKTEGSNEVVEKPEYNRITRQIGKSLIGKFSSNDQCKKKEYYMINEDGSIKISIYDSHYKPWSDRYLTFTEEEVEFVALYDENGRYKLELRLRVGAKRVFPFDIPVLSVGDGDHFSDDTDDVDDADEWEWFWHRC